MWEPHTQPLHRWISADLSSFFSSAVDCQTGHKFSLPLIACPYVMWLCSSFYQKVVYFSTPWMWASLATCFVQWNISKCDASTSLKSAWAWKFVLSWCSYNPKPPYKLANKVELACQMEKGTCPVTAIVPNPKNSQSSSWLAADYTCMSEPNWNQQDHPAEPSADCRLQNRKLMKWLWLYLSPQIWGVSFHRKSKLIYLLSFLPSSSFFLFLFICPSFSQCFFLLFFLQELQVPI